MVTKPKPGTKKLNVKRNSFRRRVAQFILWGIVGLMLAIGGFIGVNYVQSPQVTEFSWDNIKVGVNQRAFTLTFNREMDRSSVADNLTIKPPLAGEISWDGKEMTYTLAEVPLYGNRYYVQLSEAESAQSERPIEPFIGEFETRDRAFVYLGVEAEEQGRLILYNLTQQEKLTLTPPDLTVIAFEPYPQGDRILFSAFSNQRNQTQVQKLYTVTTGINPAGTKEKKPVGKLNLVLDATQQQNLKFDLADNGNTIVVQRKDPQTEVSELWVVTANGTPQPLEVQAKQFVVSPNGETLALAKPEGVTLIPIADRSQSSLLFPEYDRVLTIAPDNQATIMVKNRSDQTQALFLVNAQKERELFSTPGKILDCGFEPKQQKNLYCLHTEITEAIDGTVVEEPTLTAINLETNQQVSLLTLPNYPDVKMSIAPDGIAILFDQVVATLPQPDSRLRTRDGNAVMMAKLWLLPLPEIPTQEKPNLIPPEELVSGFRPRWLS